jgi:hypothetical protein
MKGKERLMSKFLVVEYELFDRLMQIGGCDAHDLMNDHEFCGDSEESIDFCVRVSGGKVKHLTAAQERAGNEEESIVVNRRHFAEECLTVMVKQCNGDPAYCLKAGDTCERCIERFITKGRRNCP